MGTRHQGTAAEIAALNAYIKLQRASESVAGRVHALLPPGLTSTQFGVLEALHHIGPLCQGELAEKLLKSNANLTLVVANLEKSGFVARERNPSDRRFVTVRLTDAGQRLIARLFPRIARQVARELAALSPAELAELDRLCKRVGLGA